MGNEGWKGIWRRILQVIALYVPGARTWRPRLHRWRGVRVGQGCFIGQGALIETSRPHQISIGNRVGIGARVTIVAHFRGITKADRTGDDDAISVKIEDEAFVGPGCILLPNVTIGRGAVVLAGSVVTKSVAPMTMVQGNPAQPIARCGIPFTEGTKPKEFYAKMRPLRKPGSR